VWQYSRKVDGKAQIVTFNLHTKPRRQGGRKRSSNPEDLAVGASQGPSFETLSLSEELLSVVTAATPRELVGIGPMKYLCSPDDIAGTRVQAQALAAIRFGSVNSTTSTSTASQSVQFIAIDPEVHWIREVSLAFALLSPHSRVARFT
jgi:hypothetical protein